MYVYTFIMIIKFDMDLKIKGKMWCIECRHLAHEENQRGMQHNNWFKFLNEYTHDTLNVI